MSGTKKIEQGHYLFREGDPPDAMYVIKSGKFAVVKTKQNSEITLAEMGPGSMVGEMAFFDNKPRSASVKALKESDVIILPYKALHAQMSQFPEWTKAIMRTVNDHLRNANARIKALETNDSADETLFPPHAITKLVSILNFVTLKYGTEEPDGIVVPSGTLRTYTIQVFQEATHKMQKLMTTLSTLGLMNVEDLGEGKQRVAVTKPDLLFKFVEWYNEWLFKDENDRVQIKEEELKLIQGVIHFGKSGQDIMGMSKVSLEEIQNNSMQALGYLIKMEELNPLIEKGLLGEKTAEADGKIYCTVKMDELESLATYWKIIYELGNVSR